MVDYGIDETFDIYVTDENSIAEVRGLDEFMDDLATAFHDEFGGTIGDIESAKQKIRLIINRLARQFDVIDRITRIDITEATDRPGTLYVEVVFDSGDSFTDTI